MASWRQAGQVSKLGAGLQRRVECGLSGLGFANFKIWLEAQCKSYGNNFRSNFVHTSVAPVPSSGPTDALVPSIASSKAVLQPRVSPISRICSAILGNRSFTKFSHVKSNKKWRPVAKSYTCVVVSNVLKNSAPCVFSRWRQCHNPQRSICSTAVPVTDSSKFGCQGPQVPSALLILLTNLSAERKSFCKKKGYGPMESQPKAEVRLDHSSHMDLKSDARLKAESKDCSYME